VLRLQASCLVHDLRLQPLEEDGVEVAGAAEVELGEGVHGVGDVVGVEGAGDAGGVRLQRLRESRRGPPLQRGEAPQNVRNAARVELGQYGG
jgi:hypothetical protein